MLHESEFTQVVIDGRSYCLIPTDDPRIAPQTAPEQLTGREWQVARLVAQGKVTKQIALELGIGEHTVITHIRRSFAKLGVDTRAAMVARIRTSLAA